MLVRLQRKSLNVVLSVMMLAGLLAGFVSLPSAEASPAQSAPAFVFTPVNKGWTKFSWVSSVRGSAFSISPIIPAIVPSAFVTITSVLPESTLPFQLSVAASANVTCPWTGNVVIPIRVYDFGTLINSTAYTVDCSKKFAYTDPIISHTADEYANNPHYFHATVSIPSGGAHNVVFEADLPTNDTLFWGYARVDSAPGTPLMNAMGDNGAIAATVVNPPANAWIGVQWADPTGTTWTMIDTWLGPLDQSDRGRVTHGVEPKDFGTGPYRWVVYDNNPAQGGKLWGVSTSFYFPRTARDWLWTQIRQTLK